MRQPRTAVAALVLSLSGFLTLVTQEHYTEKAVIPTKNDRPTVGHGSTVYPDGKRVKMGDTITPVRALIVAKAHIDKEETIFRASLPGVFLYPAEYDFYMNFTYQFGTGNWMKSSMRKNLLMSNYTGSCDALLLYKYAAGYDCSTLINGVPNKRCYGVWTRQLERHAECMGLQ